MSQNLSRGSATLVLTLGKDINPYKTIDLFIKQFQKDKQDLQTSRYSKTWFSEVVKILSQLPFIGFVFKSSGAHLVEDIELMHLERFSLFKTAPPGSLSEKASLPLSRSYRKK